MSHASLLLSVEGPQLDFSLEWCLGVAGFTGWLPYVPVTRAWAVGEAVQCRHAISSGGSAATRVLEAPHPAALRLLRLTTAATCVLNAVGQRDRLLFGGERRAVVAAVGQLGWRRAAVWAQELRGHSRGTRGRQAARQGTTASSGCRATTACAGTVTKQQLTKLPTVPRVEYPPAHPSCLPGYGYLGVCLDSAAALQQATTGRCTLFPLLLGGEAKASLMDAYRQASSKGRQQQEQQWEYASEAAALQAALGTLPCDTQQEPRTAADAARRALACLPEDSPFAAVAECRRGLRAALAAAGELCPAVVGSDTLQ